MHEALLYAGEREYIDGILDFVTPALNAGEPVAAAISPERGSLIRRALNGHARDVQIFDMVELGCNPARIIPHVERLLTRHRGKTLHYVGEPIWPGRSAEEIQEATKHEALINLAWPGTQIRVLCPYDTDRLAPEVLAGAERTHPAVIRHGQSQPSAAYAGAAVSDQPLPPVPSEALELGFGLDELGWARALAAEEATAAGLARNRVQDLMLAISELAGNAIRHGHGRGVLRVWRRPDRIVCQVEDGGRIRDPLAGRRMPLPDAAGGIGLWAVNQLCDLVEVRSTRDGTTVRIHTTLA